MSELKPKATLLIFSIFSFTIAGCGSGGDGGFSTLTSEENNQAQATTTIPVVAVNSPLVNVEMQVECANGVQGRSVIGHTEPGVGEITVNGECLPPIQVSASSSGKMRPLGAPDDGSQDYDYSPFLNFPLTNLSTTLPTSDNPLIISPVTTLRSALITSTSELSQVTAEHVQQATQQVSQPLGLTVNDVEQDYRNPAVAAVSNRLTKVTALISANTASQLEQTSPGAYIAETLAQQITQQNTISLQNATQITERLKSADNRLDITPVADIQLQLQLIDEDSQRIRELVELAQQERPAVSVSEISQQLQQSIASTATSQQKDKFNAFHIENALSAIRTTTSKMLVNIRQQIEQADLTPAQSQIVLQRARLVADQLILNRQVRINQNVDQRASIVSKATQMQTALTTAFIFDLNQADSLLTQEVAVNHDNLAAIMTAHAEYLAEQSSVNNDPGQQNAENIIAVARSLSSIQPINETGSQAERLSFQATVAAIAYQIDPATISNDTTAIETAITAIHSQLLNALGGNSATIQKDSVVLARDLVIDGLTTALGSANVRLSYVTPPANIEVMMPSTLATTTTTTFQPTTTTSSSTTSSTSTTTTEPSTTTSSSSTTNSSTTSTSSTTTADSTTTTSSTTTTAEPTTTTSSTTTEAPTTTTSSTTTAAPTTTTSSTTTAAPTTTTSSTTTAAPTTTTSSTTTAAPTTTTSSTTTAAPTTTTSSTTTAAPTTTTSSTTTAAPTTTTSSTTTAAPTTTTSSTTTAAPTTTTSSTTTAAPTTTTSSTTTAAPTTTTSSTTTLAPSFTCQVQRANAIGYVTDVSDSQLCTESVINVDGLGATVSTIANDSLLTGKTTITYSQLSPCDIFGAPPSTGEQTLTPCKR